MTEIKRFLLPDEMEPVSHYCHATRAGDRVWVSDTVGVRSDGTIPEDTVEQFQVAIDTVDRCLKAAGAEARHPILREGWIKSIPHLGGLHHSYVRM